MKIGLLVCGPSGVGKSSHISEMLSHSGSNFLVIDPDKLEGSHSEQSKTAYQNVLDAIETGQNFVYPATCGGIRLVTNILHRMKDKNYKTVVAIVYTSLPVALERIKKRTHQPVPDDVVEDLHKFFKSKAERYMKIPEIDELYLYNNEEQFSLLLSKKKKIITCRNSNSDFYFDISKYCS